MTKLNLLTLRCIKFRSKDPYSLITEGPISNSRWTMSGANERGSNSCFGLNTFFLEFWKPFGLIGDNKISSFSGVVISRSIFELTNGGDGWYT